MKLLTFLLKRSRGTLLLAVGAGLVSGATSTGLLMVLHSALSQPSKDHGSLLWGFLLLCLLTPTCRVFSQYLLADLGQQAVLELRSRLTRRILSTALERLEALGFNRLAAALIDDVEMIGDAMVLIPGISVTVSIVVGCLAYMAWLSGSLFLVLLVVMAIGIVSYRLPSAWGSRRFQAAREERDILFEHFHSLTEGIQELKLHQRRANAFVGLVDSTGAVLARLYVSALTIFSAAASWGHLLLFVVLGALIFAVPHWQEVDSSTLIGYSLALLYMLNPLQAILDSIPALSRSGVALAKLETLGLSLSDPTTDSEVPLALRWASWQRLAFQGLTYRYQRGGRHEFVLGPMDLEFQPGEIIFLIGGNGSGKTTLAKLLSGLYPPTNGRLTIDGEPINDENRTLYRQHFSMTFATPHLFGSLLGLEHPDLDRQAQICLQALELEKKVTISDGKFSTTELSQGQRKRLALLTAYLEDRPIYIFDEWAADQDPIFREVFYSKILSDLKKRGKTIFVISHDDRYYCIADRILKLDNGELQYDGAAAGLNQLAAPRVREP